MPYFNKPFFGQDENPLIKSPFYVTWNDDVGLPPPASEGIISELGDFVISEAGDFMITE